MTRPPKGPPVSTTPHHGRPPREHAVGKPPNPRTPELVRVVDGGALKDLFALFPDLPRPPRPRARVPTRVQRRALRPWLRYT